MSVKIKRRGRRRLLGLFSTYRHADLEDSGRDRRLWRGRFDVYDGVALGFIAIILLVLLARVNGLHPFVSDTYYHLAIGKIIADRGELPLWVDWDYAPVGRPHLYPPLIHFVLAGLYKLTGNILTAGQILAVLFLPASFLTCWYAARWIFNSRTALMSVIALSLGFGHSLVQLIYIPSCIINILAPLAVVCLLTRRTLATIILVTLMGYSHLGISYLAAFGMVLFAWKYPKYRGETLIVLFVSGIFAAPWLVHVLNHREWLDAGVGMGALQMLNLVLAGCGIWGLFALHKSRVQEAIIPWMLLGMLPLLFSYGGRYMMHSVPFWAMSAGYILVKLLPEGASWKRATALAAATLLPSPAWPPVTTTIAIADLAITGTPLFAGSGDRSETLLDDCHEIADWLTENTPPGEVIHTNKEWIADMIPMLTDRASDFGCWWECSREIGKIQNLYYRDSGRRAVFVCIRPETDAGSILGPTQKLPYVDEKIEVGRFDLGVRWERSFGLRQVIDEFPPAAEASHPWRTAGGSRASIGVNEPGQLVWHIPPPSREGAKTKKLKGIAERAFRIQRATRITRPISLHGATGIAFNIRASMAMKDARVGVTEADGSRYEWVLSIPSIAEPLRRIETGDGTGEALWTRAQPEPGWMALFRWMPFFGESEDERRADISEALWTRARADFGWMTLSENSEDGNDALDLDAVDLLWLSGPGDLWQDLCIEIDDVALMDVEVAGEPMLPVQAEADDAEE